MGALYDALYDALYLTRVAQNFVQGFLLNFEGFAPCCLRWLLERSRAKSSERIQYPRDGKLTVDLVRDGVEKFQTEPGAAAPLSKAQQRTGATFAV